MAEPILKDSIAVGLDRLTEQFEESPNIVGTLESFLEETQNVEDLAFEVNGAFDKGTAIGAQLDVIGKLVGVKRRGNSDSAYRDEIDNQIDANTADGTIDNIISILKNSLGESITYPNDLNYMPSPFDPSGWHGNTNEGTDTIDNIVTQNPSGEEYIGLATQVGTDQLILATNRYTNPLPVVIGDIVYVAMIIKKITPELAIRFRWADGQGFRSNEYYDIDTATTDQGGLVTPLGNDYYSVQSKWVVERDDPSLYSEVFFWDEGVGATPVGSQVYVQAAFFGKANDWPAVYSDGSDKSVKVFEHFPADIHVFVQDREGSVAADVLDEIASAGVTRTLEFLPEGGNALITQELETLRRFLFTDNSDQIVTNDGVGGLSELVVSTIEQSSGDQSAGYLAEVDPNDGEVDTNICTETLKNAI